MTTQGDAVNADCPFPAECLARKSVRSFAARRVPSSLFARCREVLVRNMVPAERAGGSRDRGRYVSAIHQLKHASWASGPNDWELVNPARPSLDSLAFRAL